jgi:hypothetical protein
MVVVPLPSKSSRNTASRRRILQLTDFAYSIAELTGLLDLSEYGKAAPRQPINTGSLRTCSEQSCFRKEVRSEPIRQLVKKYDVSDIAFASIAKKMGSAFPSVATGQKSQPEGP